MPEERGLELEIHPEPFSASNGRGKHGKEVGETSERFVPQEKEMDVIRANPERELSPGSSGRRNGRVAVPVEASHRISSGNRVSVETQSTEELQHANGPESGQTCVEETSDKYDIEWLDLSRSVIDDKETKLMARALEANRCKNLKVLFLHRNAGDLGMRAALNSLRAGNLTSLEKLIMWEVSSYDQITTAEEGTDIIAEALRKGSCPKLHTLDLTGSLPKLKSPRGFCEVIGQLTQCTCGEGRLRNCCQIFFGCLICCGYEDKKHQALDCFRCECCRLNVFSGDDGIRKIARALSASSYEHLKVLNLQENWIGDKGAKAIARNLKRGNLPDLQELDLRNNPVHRSGAWEIVFAFLVNPLLTVRVKMDWPSFGLEARSITFRENNIRLEFRLEDMKLLRGDIALNESRNDNPPVNFIYPGFHLHRPQKGFFKRLKADNSHRLHLHCQSHCERYDAEGMVEHEVYLSDGEEPGGEPVGIEIKKRLRCQDPASGFVDREPDDLSEEDEFRDGSDDLLPVAPVNKHLDKKETSLKMRKGVNRIYITAGSFGFIGAAKNLSSTDRRRRKCYVHLQKLFESNTKTELRIHFILEELFMLAERKPDEFFKLFGLRQVLLKNPAAENKYSRVWICESCYDVYRGKNCVQPVTRDSEIFHSTREGEPYKICSAL